MDTYLSFQNIKESCGTNFEFSNAQGMLKFSPSYLLNFISNFHLIGGTDNEVLGTFFALVMKLSKYIKN